jgi:hypothetical protein
MGKEDFKKVDDGLKLLELNLRRIIDKYQHLAQSIQYLGDDLAVFQNNLNVVTNLFNQLKSRSEGDERK